MLPYILNEKPELREKFDGFCFYQNTVSFGAFTNFGSPALYGGYEYTPVEMNRRDEEPLVEKHNEALKVVPTVFAEEGYKVTVMEPSYAGYEWIPDLSIYDDLPDVHAYHVDGAFMDDESRAQTIEARKRNFFLFSVMKTMPVSVQSPIYNRGKYLAVGGNNISSVDQNFLNEYNTLQNMATMTEITSGDERTYMFLRSDITHEPVELQEPNYEPSATVNNRPFYAKGKKVITDGISSYVLTRQGSLKHYHVNMAAMILLGNWFDYLRENGLYDNTRIILVSDHGTHNGLLDETDDLTTDIDYYLPLLMVKDFNAKGFTTSDAFMTNADVPTLSFEGLVESPVNPYTGNPINSSYKEEHANSMLFSPTTGRSRRTTVINSCLLNGQPFPEMSGTRTTGPSTWSAPSSPRTLSSKSSCFTQQNTPQPVSCGVFYCFFRHVLPPDGYFPSQTMAR